MGREFGVAGWSAGHAVKAEVNRGAALRVDQILVPAEELPAAPAVVTDGDMPERMAPRFGDFLSNEVDAISI